MMPREWEALGKHNPFDPRSGSKTAALNLKSRLTQAQSRILVGRNLLPNKFRNLGFHLRQQPRPWFSARPMFRYHPSSGEITSIGAQSD